MTNIERARELLAAELESAGLRASAARTRDGENTFAIHVGPALRAIAKALDRPEPVEDGLIVELRALLEKATPGEWKVTADGCGIYAQYGDIADMVLNDKVANAALIVFLRNNAEALLSRIAKAPVDDGVMQADRDAAADYLELVAPKFPNLAEEVRTKQIALARAFARHRLRHTPDREAIALSEAVRTILARCEALEDEASDGLASVIANSRSETHEAGFWRGQKSTAKSIRNHLHDLTRQLIAMIEGGGFLRTAISDAPSKAQKGSPIQEGPLP